MRKLLIATVGVAALAGCEWLDATETAFCREAVLGRLRSPGSVKWIDVKRFADLKEVNVYIDFDAANAYGTPVRGSARCEFAADDLIGFRPVVISVNGDIFTDDELHAMVLAKRTDVTIGKRLEFAERRRVRNEELDRLYRECEGAEFKQECALRLVRAAAEKEAWKKPKTIPASNAP